MKRRGPVKLHIGCGGWIKYDYINIDKYHPKADEKMDACRLEGYKDNSVDEILVSHLVEHLPRRDVIRALQEWYRVLKAGGKLMIRCPNFELYLREWLEGSADYREGQGMMNIFGHDEEGWYHTQGFTKDMLEKQIKKAGFSTVKIEVTKNPWHTPEHPEYRENGDIYCEAAKITHGCV